MRTRTRRRDHKGLAKQRARSSEELATASYKSPAPRAMGRKRLRAAPIAPRRSPEPGTDEDHPHHRILTGGQITRRISSPERAPPHQEIPGPLLPCRRLRRAGRGLTHGQPEQSRRPRGRILPGLRQTARAYATSDGPWSATPSSERLTARAKTRRRAGLPRFGADGTWAGLLQETESTPIRFPAGRSTRSLKRYWQIIRVGPAPRVSRRPTS